MDEIERWFRLRSKWLTLPPMDRGPEEFQERLKTSSFIGVPGSHRQWVWPYLVMTHKRKLVLSASNTYRKLVVRTQDPDTAATRRIEWKNLAQDLLQMKTLDAKKFESLQTILQAYSLRDTSPSYCHGMADICVLMMDRMDEENIFWMLAIIVEVLFPDYYQDSMEGFHTDCQLIGFFLEQKDAELNRHLTKHHISIHLLCTKWLLSLYAGCFPLALPVFDMILSQSEPIACSNLMVSLTVNLILQLKDVLLETEDASEAVKNATNYCSNMLQDDVNILLQQCRMDFESYDQSSLDQLRVEYSRTLRDTSSRLDVQPDELTVEAIETTETNAMRSKTPFATPASPWAVSVGNFSFRKNTHSPRYLEAHDGMHLVESPGTVSPTIVKWRQYKRAVQDTRTHNDSRLILEIRKLSFEGVPESHRSWVWPLLLDKQIRKMTLFSPSYSQLVEDAHGWDTQSAVEIDRDIERTSFVRDSDGEALRRILLAYSEKNKSIGYCQGMNELTGMLLHTMDEETSFWALSVILEVLIPEYHVNSMIGLHMDCAVILSLLHQQDLELYQHLQKIGINMQVLCTKWLMTCFVTSLPTPCTFRVLDMLLSCANEDIHASRVLLGMALAILLGLRDEIVSRNESGDVMLVISSFLNTLSDTVVISDLFHTAKELIDTLHREKIARLRKRHRHQVATEFAALELNREERRKSSSTNEKTSTKQSGKKKRFSLPRSIKSAFTQRKPKAPLIISRSLSDPNDRVEIRAMGRKLERVAKMYQDGDVDQKEYQNMQQRIVEACYGEPVSPRTAQIRVDTVQRLQLDN